MKLFNVAPFPTFQEVDVNKDGLADYAEMSAWVLGRQSTQDIKALKDFHCLPEHVDPQDAYAKFKKSSNDALTDDQKERFHSFIKNYCFPMVHYPLRNSDENINYNRFGMVYPTTQIETINNKDSHSVSPQDFEDRMVDQQFNKKLDVCDVVQHFIFANQTYDFKGNQREPDRAVGYPGDENGYGGFNLKQWNKLFNCQP